MSDPFHASSIIPCPGPTNFGSNGRRGFIRMGLAGFTSLSLPGLLRLQTAMAQESVDNSRPRRGKTAVIMVWKPGGCSHLDTYDPKPEASSEYRCLNSEKGKRLGNPVLAILIPSRTPLQRS